MSTGLATQALTLSEYLAMEEVSATRHEFYNGLVVEMSGGTENHIHAASNLLVATSIAIRERPCVVYGSDLKIYLLAADKVVYPDVFVICGPVKFLAQRKDVVTNPLVVFEVLSDSTESNDRGRKFAGYQTLPSLQAYVLVAQDEPRVERFLRTGNDWMLSIYEGLDAVLELPPLECAIPLAEIYRKVTFPPRGDLQVVAETA